MRRALAVFLLASLCGAARAADAVLAKVRGPVYYRAGGSQKYVPAKGGEELLYGDRVRTGPGAIAQLVLGDGRGAVLVREDSSFTLEGEPGRTSLNFRVGEFLIGLRRSLEKGQSFQVRTPAAVAAVRGTLFWGKSAADKTTTYAGFGHAIEVTAQGRTVVVDAGRTTTIGFGQAPSAPVKHQIPASYLDAFAIDGGLQDLKSLVDLPADAPKP